MDAREERGIKLAAAKGDRFRRKGDLWLVPSASGGSTYIVDPAAQTCTCPDAEENRAHCKHRFALEYKVRWDVDPSGRAEVTQTLTLSGRGARTWVDDRDWSAYNRTACDEEARFKALLSDLRFALPPVLPKVPEKGGRPRIFRGDLFANSVWKTYQKKSGRRLTTSLDELVEEGVIYTRPHYNSNTRYLQAESTTEDLLRYMWVSAAPLCALTSPKDDLVPGSDEEFAPSKLARNPDDVAFAVDSSGFETSIFSRWMEEKHGAPQERRRRKFMKLHLMANVRTHVITAAVVTTGNANDSPYLPELAHQTAQFWKVAEIMADKGYLSAKNLETGESYGRVWIPFKVDSREDGAGDATPEQQAIWTRLHRYYNDNREAFLKRYHRRSTVECVFWMLKSAFGPGLSMKTERGQINEILCKVIGHNLRCVIRSFDEIKAERAAFAKVAV